VFPLNVKVPLDEPVQTVPPPVTLPPTELGVTVTVVEEEVAAVHEPY
jgi:hypothetical protein